MTEATVLVNLRGYEEPLFSISHDGDPGYMIEFLYPLLREAMKFGRPMDIYYHFVGRIAFECATDCGICLFEWSGFPAYEYKIDFENLIISWKEKIGEKEYTFMLDVKKKELRVENKIYKFETEQEIREILEKSRKEIEEANNGQG